MTKSNIKQFFSTNALLLIVLLGFVIRMVFFVSLQPWDQNRIDTMVIADDATEYHQLATSILSLGSFDGFDGFRTPGYPTFVAALYSISSNSVPLVLFIQVILNILSILLVYKIAVNAFSRNIALLSAFIFSIDIHQALYAVTLCTDTLFVFVFLAAIYYLYMSMKEKNIRLLVLGAFILGVSSLVRPVGFPFSIVALIFILLFCRELKFTTRSFYAIVYASVFLITISPWLIRNYTKFGEAKLTTQYSINLLFENVTSTEAYKTGKPIELVKKEFKTLAIAQGADSLAKNPFKNAQIYSDIAKGYIKDNFGLFFQRHFVGLLNMYVGLSTRHIAQIFHLRSNPLSINQEDGPNVFLRMADFFESKTKSEYAISSVLIIYLLINYVFATYALFLFLRKKELLVYLLVLIILYFSMVTGVIAVTRLRIPVMPFINILSAVGIFYFYQKTKPFFIKKNNISRA